MKLYCEITECERAERTMQLLNIAGSLLAACKTAEQFTDALVECVISANLADDLGGRQVRDILRAAIAQAEEVDNVD